MDKVSKFLLQQDFQDRRHYLGRAEATPLTDKVKVFCEERKMDSDQRATFKQETIHKVFQLKFKDEKTKINSDALKVANEVLRVFVDEAAARAAHRAEDESSPVVTIDHFEKILPQLMLDF